MGIFDSLGSLWDWLTTQSPGGSAGGTPYLGAGSPTASTQTPTLGGQPPAQGGFLSGLLGGQQPVNPMSYFQPQGGGLLGFGNTPLGGIIRGGLEGLGSAQGVGGLTGVGVAAMGAGQAEQQRRQNQMATLAAGQQYQAGQAQQAMTNMQIAEALRNYNIMNQVYNKGAPLLTYSDLMNDPQKLSQVMASSGSATLASITGGPTGTVTQPPMTGTTAPATPIAPTYLQSGQPQTITSPTGVTTTTQPDSPITQLRKGLLSYEGGGNPNAVDPKSGAIAGLTPGTFDLYNKQYFGGKLNFANAGDREAVNNQLLTDLYRNAGGDVNRVLAGYFTGKMAPPGSPTPWTDPNFTDANGVNVVDYINGVRGKMMLPPLDAGGAVSGGAGQGQQVATTAPSGGDQLTAAFAQSHYGYTPAQWRQIGVATGNKGMQDEADKWDATLITGTAAATAAGTPYPGRPGGQMQTSTGQPIGRGTPQLTNVIDPNGNSVPANIYPNGDIQYLGGPNAGKTVSAGAAGSTPGGGPITQPSVAATEQQKIYAQQLGQWGQGIRPGMVAESQLNTLANALSQTAQGKWTTNKADIIDSIKAIPGLEGFGKTLEQMTGVDPTAVSVALRNQFAAVVGQVMPNLSTTAQAQMAQAQAALAGPDHGPEANRQIIGQIIGTIKWDRDMYRAASKDFGQHPQDPNDFAAQWGQDHPVDDYIKKATDGLPVMKGTAAPAQPKPAAPKPGDIQTSGGQKWKFTGGDPSSPNNWELVP